MKIVKTSTLPEVGVTHNPEVKKKVFIEKGTVPNLFTLGEATFQPGQFVEKHLHESAFEVFYIQSGKAVFNIENVDYQVGVGDCITIGPGEVHYQSNPYQESVKWVYMIIKK